MKNDLKRIFFDGIRYFCFGICFGLGLSTFDLIAVNVSGTMNTFFSGQIIKSSEINTNFSSLRTAIESIPDWTKNGVNAVFSSGAVIINTSNQANSATVTVNGRISSSNLGVYCGATAAPYTGNIGGYVTAKSLCEASSACNNSNAHMCTSHELAISRQLGISITGNTWYSSHSYWDGAEPSVFIADCDGWTSDSGSLGGSFNNPSSTYGSWNYCNNSYRIACCL